VILQIGVTCSKKTIRPIILKFSPYLYNTISLSMNLFVFKINKKKISYLLQKKAKKIA